MVRRRVYCLRYPSTTLPDTHEEKTKFFFISSEQSPKRYTDETAQTLIDTGFEPYLLRKLRYGRCQAVFQGKSKDFSYIPKKRVTVPLSKLQMLHFGENAASERTVNVTEKLSVYEDNAQNNFGSRQEQGGSVEEKNRDKVPGRTGGLNERLVIR